MMKLRIKPQKLRLGVEPCILEIQPDEPGADFYPVAVVHVDNFWQGRNGDNTVYNLLRDEKTVTLDVSLVPAE